ncbi:hypothetical protein J4219_01625 [Candidatus Woesearchaeota archaeon]|nr:hypothetical protein [Candidatus Woesearchaeota archaeon]
MNQHPSLDEPERTLFEGLTTRANAFIEGILTNEIDFAFLDYARNCNATPLIAEFRYVTRAKKHDAYFCEGHHHGRNWSPHAKTRINHLTKTIEQTLIEQGHTLLEGSYYLDDETGLASNITFCTSENYTCNQPERTKTCFEHWMNRVKHSPTGNLRISLELLNYVDPPGTDRGDAKPFQGLYSIRYENPAQQTLKFFSTTLPTAIWLLNKSVRLPLNSYDEAELRCEILRLVQPLVTDGHSLIED